ncbi:hypothetical protein EW026_g4202 [Hermanssonia centrifuga]|uniref:Uncharacterized protein n=1 Tax=Hermanssonia centrifuga TaxID=98765 RepID=A0A4S4KHV3_9APHY|nr:hypothetical protein EW026_g4202 [Hermanssonia centrifuga]
MSKTAAGNIQGTNSSTISGKFVEDDGTEHFCTGTIDPATVFVVSEAVLTYNGSLLGKHTYQGTVGKTAIALTQDNGYTITAGALAKLRSSPRSSSQPS